LEWLPIFAESFPELEEVVMECMDYESGGGALSGDNFFFFRETVLQI
jgi:hypothetical protein